MFVRVFGWLLILLPLAAFAVDFADMGLRHPSAYDPIYGTALVAVSVIYLISACVLLIFSLIQKFRKRGAKRLALWGLTALFLGAGGVASPLILEDIKKNKYAVHCDRQIEAKLANDALPTPTCIQARSPYWKFPSTYSKFCKLTDPKTSTDGKSYMKCDKRAKELVDATQYKLALDDYTRAIRLTPKQALLYRDRGRLYYYHGESKRAIVDFDKAIELLDSAKNKNKLLLFSVEAFRSAAVKLMSDQTVKRATFDIKYPLHMKRSRIMDAYMNRGRAYLSKKDYKAAIADFSAVISKLDNNEFASLHLYAAYLERARTYQYSGQNRKALDAYNAADLKLSEHSYVAGCSPLKKANEKVCELANVFIRNVHLGRAEIQIRMAKFNAAIKDYEDFIKMSSGTKHKVLLKLAEKKIADLKMKMKAGETTAEGFGADFERAWNDSIKPEHAESLRKRARTARAFCNDHTTTYNRMTIRACTWRLNHEATKDFQRIVYLYVRATTYEITKKYKKALEDYQAIVKLQIQAGKDADLYLKKTAELRKTLGIAGPKSDGKDAKVGGAKKEPAKTSSTASSTPPLILMDKKCEGGDAEACYMVGHGLEQLGHGLEQQSADLSTKIAAAMAMIHYRKACDGGYAKGCYSFGRMYYEDFGAHNKWRALLNFERACKGGYKKACKNARIMKKKGEGRAPEVR